MHAMRLAEWAVLFALVWCLIGSLRINWSSTARDPTHTDMETPYLHHMRAKFGLSPSKSAVLFVSARLVDLANAAVLSAGLIQRLEEWGVEYERRHTYRCPGGVISPKINIGDLRAGTPHSIVRPPSECTLYLECRIVPNQDPLAIREELRDMLAEMGLPGEVELYLYRPGYEAQGIKPLVERLARAHRYEFGSDLEVAALEV